ncbi:hypothetical protein RU01_10650 [Rhodococcus sp. MEB064]|nr:hypothetical protein RU01_10650 [Rhodococcus sp. MEB064]
MQGASESGEAVHGQEDDAGDGHDGDGRRVGLDHDADAGHTGKNQDRVGQRAHQHHREDVLPGDSLTQHECVLCADGDDE